MKSINTYELWFNPFNKKIMASSNLGKIRFPAKRSPNDNIIKITKYLDLHKVEILNGRRNSNFSEEFHVWDDTIIISEYPHKICTAEVSCCLAIVLADKRRQIASAIHTYSSRDMDQAINYSLWAMNSDSKDIVIGLSGMRFTYSDGSEDKEREKVAFKAGQFGKIIYNELGQKGDIGIDLKNRIIYYPYDIQKFYSNF